MLTYRSNSSLAKKLIRAKLKRPQHKKLNKNNSHTSSSSSNCSNGNSEYCSCKNEAVENSMRISDLADIQHNIGIGLKRTTKKCNDHGGPLHKLNCTNQARSNISGWAYITCGLANCNTKYVVYMIQCKKCNKQYVGQTGQSLRQRIAAHLRNFRDHRVEHHAQPLLQGSVQR